MPHFFIDTDDGESFVQDDEGHALPDAAAARELALGSLSEMAVDGMPGGDRQTFSVRVRDEQGAILYAADLRLTGEWLIPPST